MQKIYFAIASVFYVVIFWLRVFEFPEIAKFCIPAFVLMVALYSFINAKDKSLKQGSLLLTLALAFAFCADAVINFISVQIGVMVFFATHICLVIYYLKKKPLERKEVLYIAPLLAITIMFCMAVVPHTSDKLYIYGIPAYMVLLTVMLWRAVCLFNDKDNLKIILGSALFYLTDISVIMMLAYGDSTALNIEAWAMYPPALFLLSLVGNKEHAKK
ncbi:MAG: lysoplasmalogenase family protein [Fibromonadaceae bacterium]|jgi:uncharacterized membrane protein YfcA|nr:lysoplasmalogenase family protein [Fibromonadaceae bacterium]